jgi:MFS family permease
VQLLDGVGAGIFGAITPLVLADLMRGTGRYNLAQGAIGTAQGIGAASSGLAAGLIVDHFGYSAAFMAASAVAAGALLVLAGLMPETKPETAGAVISRREQSQFRTDRNVTARQGGSAGADAAGGCCATRSSEHARRAGLGGIPLPHGLSDNTVAGILFAQRHQQG